jgi:hypothetical protein
VTRFKRDPRTLFARIGMLLYGDGFVSQLSEELGIAERTVQRWSSGAREVPPYVWGRLIEMLGDEGKTLRDASKEAATEKAKLEEEIRQWQESGGGPWRNRGAAQEVRDE